MLAIRSVAQFIVEVSFPQVVFEDNFKGIVKVLTKGYSALSSFGHLRKYFKWMIVQHNIFVREWTI